MKTGFFTMKDAVQVLRSPDLESAKSHLKSQIAMFVEEHPGTQTLNILKANKMIDTARNIEKLSIDVSNFVLAHPSEGLKVLK